MSTITAFACPPWCRDDPHPFDHTTTEIGHEAVLLDEDLNQDGLSDAADHARRATARRRATERDLRAQLWSDLTERTEDVSRA